MSGKIRIIIFRRIRPEYRWFEGSGQNFNVSDDKVRFPMFGRIGPKFQSLKG